MNLVPVRLHSSTEKDLNKIALTQFYFSIVCSETSKMNVVSILFEW